MDGSEGQGAMLFGYADRKKEAEEQTRAQYQDLSTSTCASGAVVAGQEEEQISGDPRRMDGLSHQNR